MDKLCMIMDKVEDKIAEQFEDLESIDTKEMGEVVDMLKDMYMIKYYHDITEAMEKSEYGKDYDIEGRIKMPNM